MHALILGGTGFIGQHVIRQLAANRHEVTVYSRGNRRPDLPASTNYMTGDYKNLPDDRKQFADLAPDVVVDMIPLAEQQARAVMRTFHGIVHRVVAISSQDVYRAWGYLLGLDRGPVEPHITEESPLRVSRFPYRGQKLPVYLEWDLETYDKVPVEAAFQSDPVLPATILRLPMVYGPGDPARRTYPWLKRMDDGRAVIPLEQPLARWRGPMGYVEDVAKAIALAAIDDAATGRIYNVAEPDVSSTAEFIRDIADVVGWGGRVVELPTGALPSPWSEYHLEQHILTDSNRIRRELGYRETMQRAEALRRTIEWERANPPDPLPRAMFDYAAEDRALEDYGAIARSGSH